MRTHEVVVGTAGWSLPRDTHPEFPSEGTHLSRYAGRFRGVEINSSFYRPHRPATYQRWAGSVPPGFRFAVKVPRTITHEHALTDVDELLDSFLAEAGALGDALGPLLVQLPPSRVFDRAVAVRFFETMRERHAGPVVLEARHPSWFTPEVDVMLAARRVSGVAADPARVSRATAPSGEPGLVYYRLHGSPVMYRSSYDAAYLERLADTLERHRERGAKVWCIFDNTANGAATANALTLDSARHAPLAVAHSR
jgi:uncharacterized protein YecE (DUF72 family)